MRYEVSVVVDRPFDEVVAFVSDFPFNLPRLGGGTLSLRQTSPGPAGLGSTFQSRIAILGFEVRLSLTLTELDWPNAAVLSFTGAGTRSGHIRMTLEATSEGTKFIRVLELEPKPTYRLLWWIAWPFMKRRSEAGNRRLKRLLETGVTEPGGQIDAP
jgi:carbon monoxide dehydrogenase subunit G